jgi:hypothetical protein
VHRWQEECLLLKEEMRRVLEFFDWEISRWNYRAEQNLDMKSAELKEGSRSYAYQQANIGSIMREQCKKKWREFPENIVLAGEFKDTKTGLVEVNP